MRRRLIVASGRRWKTLPRLGSASAGRDNNFTLIRLCASVAVLVSHAWPITGGPGTKEPLAGAIGHSLGSIAVFIFFALSGYFIAGSFQRAASVRHFVLARVARLWPGLAVSLLFVAFILGPLVTSRPLQSYLVQPDLLSFFLRNLTLIKPQYQLVDLFQDQPYPAVEGSIWTLSYEVACYTIVLLCGVLGLLRNRKSMMGTVAVYLVLWSSPLVFDLPLHPSVSHMHSLSFPFMTGVSLWIWRDRVVLSLHVLLVLAVLGVGLRTTALAFPALVIALTYGTFWLGHAPRGFLRKFNGLGDYSYGIYIYAFPLQGFAIWCWGSMTPAMNILSALPMTMICAILSWHMVEQPAMRFAQRTADGRNRSKPPLVKRSV